MRWKTNPVPAMPSYNSLLKTVPESDKALADTIKLAKEAQQEYGGRYGWHDDGKTRPLNLIHRAVTVTVASLAAKSAAHAVEGRNSSARSAAKVWSARLDQLYRETGRKRLMRLALMDAIFTPISIRRTGIRLGAELELLTNGHTDPAECYCIRVPLSDWICDPYARDWPERRIEGNRYAVNRRVAVESEMFKGFEDELIGLSKAKESRDRRATAAGVEKDQRSLEAAGDQIELMDLFVFEDGPGGAVTQMTFPGDYEAAKALLASRGRPLLERPYVGYNRHDTGGPYRHMQFHPVPDQLLGAASVAAWREQAEIFYGLVNKQVEELKRTRRHLIGKKQVNADDLETIKNALDSDVLDLDEPEYIREMLIGAELPGLNELASNFLGYFTVSANDPNVLGNAGEQTDKATIYAGQQASAGAVLDDMLASAEDAEREISEDYLWWEMYYPVGERTVSLPGPNGEIIDRSFSPQDLDADFMEMTVKIKPRSTVRVDHTTRAAAIMELVPKAAELVMAELNTGGRIDAAAGIRILAASIGEEDLSELIRDQAILANEALLAGVMPPPPPPGMGMQGPGAMGGPQGMGAGMRPSAGFSRLGGGGAAVGAQRSMGPHRRQMNEPVFVPGGA